MKYLRVLLPIMLFLQLGFTNKLNAQFDFIDQFGNIISAGPDNAEKLLKAYLSPYVNAFGASLSGGWYNTAKPHKLGGFDLTFTFNTSIISPSLQSFDVDAIGLDRNTLVRADGTENMSPTIAGSKEKGPLMQYPFEAPLNKVDAFELPKGTNWRYIPTPMIQLGIGFIKETELIGRWMPTIKRDNLNIGLWGVGIKHSIKQYIPALKKAPVFNLSVLGGYTRLTTNFGLNVTPATVGLNSFNTMPASTWENQGLDIITSSFTGNLLLSADLPVVCFYGGLGFTRTKTNLKIDGNYPMLNTDNLSAPYVEAMAETIDFQIKNQDGGLTKARLNLGMRLKLGLITMQFDYTRANYNVATLGLGINFR